MGSSRVVDDPVTTAFSATRCSPSHLPEAAGPGNHAPRFGSFDQCRLERSILFVGQVFLDEPGEQLALDETDHEQLLRHCRTTVKPLRLSRGHRNATPRLHRMPPWWPSPGAALFGATTFVWCSRLWCSVTRASIFCQWATPARYSLTPPTRATASPTRPKMRYRLEPTTKGTHAESASRT
jgi:hypothetical protein